MVIAEAQLAQEAVDGLVSLEDTLTCIRCGQCSYTCPTYRAVLCESSAPRGRVALLRAAAEGKLGPSEIYSRKFFDCVLCAACTNACPTGMEVDQLLLQARQRLFAAGLLPAPLQHLIGQLATSHNIAGEDNQRRLSWTENMAMQPQHVHSGEAETVYFVGCVSSYFPMSYNIPQAFVQCLDAADVRYGLLGGEEWCCGYPALISGNMELARELALHNVEAIRSMGTNRLVVTCPSCYHIFSHMYRDLAGDLAGQITVLHSSELLKELIEEGRLTPGNVNMTVTYHDPCDLGRKSGLYDAPRAVLGAIPGITLVEMAANRAESLCCGGGGNVETNDPELVSAMAVRRFNQASGVGAEAIVTSCQQCKRTLSAAARRQRARMRTFDVVEIVLQSLESARR